MLLEGVMSRPAGRSMLTPEVFRVMQQKYRHARVFVFDEAASRSHGQFSINCADLVVKNEEFAIPPFDNCYIEIDNRASLEATESLRVKIADDASIRLGYWFIDEAVYCLAGDEKEPWFTPFVYRRVGSKPTRWEAFDGASYYRSKAILFLGQMSEELDEERDKLAPVLADRWDFAITKEIPEAAFREFFRECTGGLKRALAALLLLNQRQSFTVTDKPPQRKIVNGKQRVYMGHSLVTIDLGPKTIRKAFYTGLRDTPRAHEVRGEFVHRYRVSGCTHVWEKVVDPEKDAADIDRVGYLIPRWACKHCTGTRTWRRPHQRGDSAKGFVTKTYEVTKSP